jgi:hypothetical protein
VRHVHGNVTHCDRCADGPRGLIGRHDREGATINIIAQMRAWTRHGERLPMLVPLDVPAMKRAHASSKSSECSHAKPARRPASGGLRSKKNRSQSCQNAVITIGIMVRKDLCFCVGAA